MLEAVSMKTRQTLLVIIATVTFVETSLLPVFAQKDTSNQAKEEGTAKKRPDRPIDAKTRHDAVKALIKAVEANYIFPDAAMEMSEMLSNRLQRDGYKSISSSREFAIRLTVDLREVCHDKHIGIDYDHIPIEDKKESPQERERRHFIERTVNLGLKKVEVLPGNVGYIDLRYFASPGRSGDTLSAAMTLVQHTGALVIDLRNNNGGSPAMVACMASYFFDKESVHMNDIYDRENDSTRQWWTLSYVPGPRYIDKPVYIVTSRRTFSAAEAFAYNLQALKRATVVGETTGGGAHPTMRVGIGKHFSAWIPAARATNRITKTNWEGHGVTPDIAVKADVALDTSYLRALKQLRQDKTFEPIESNIDRAIEDVTARLNESTRK